jgi:hypothetical protein
MHRLATTLRRLGSTIRLAMCKLNEIQFAAPRDPARNRCPDL